MSYRYKVKWDNSEFTYSERLFDIKPWIPDVLQSALDFARELLSSGQVCTLSKQEWQADIVDKYNFAFVWTDIESVELHSPDECTPDVKLEPLYIHLP